MNDIERARKTWDDLLTVSQMLIRFAISNDESPASTVISDPSDNGLIIPNNPGGIQYVQKDGPNSKSRTKNAPPVVSLRTLDGQLYVFDHGKMVQKGYFEYQHFSRDLMTSLLRIGPDVPSLVPDHPDIPDTTLLKQEKHSTPTSETALLMSTGGITLALEYSDNPENPHAKLVLLNEKELKLTMKKIEQKEEMIFKVNPLLKIRTHTEEVGSASIDGGANNIALYYETSKFYYYIHVSTDNPPKLVLEQVNRTPDYNPHQDYIRHLQFKEKPVVNLRRDEPDGATLDSIPEEEGHDKDEAKDDLTKFRDLSLERSQSEGSASKPTSLDIVGLRGCQLKEAAEQETAADQADDIATEDKAVHIDSATSIKDVKDHNGTSTEPAVNGTVNV